MNTTEMLQKQMAALQKANNVTLPKDDGRAFIKDVVASGDTLNKLFFYPAKSPLGAIDMLGVKKRQLRLHQGLNTTPDGADHVIERTVPFALAPVYTHAWFQNDNVYYTAQSRGQNVEDVVASMIQQQFGADIQDLAFGSHTVVGTFKGDDPANAPSSGAGTARGWVYVNGSNSFLTYRTFKTQITNSREKDLLVGFSNKEYAIKIRKKGIGTHQFVPMHSNIGTAFNAEPMRILVDGASWSPSTAVIGEFIECSSFRLVQHVYGRNPDSGAENLIDMATTVSINKKGCAEISGKMKVLQDIDVLDGYFIMVPLAKPMIDRAVTSINNTYACTKTDGTKTYLDTEGDKGISYAFVSGTEKDYVTTVRFCDSKNTLRTGGSGKYAYGMNTWLEHRDATLTKLYASAFSNTTLTTGQSFRFSGSIMPAKIPGVNDFL